MSDRQICCISRVKVAVVQVMQDVLLCTCAVLKWVLCLGAGRNYTNIADKLSAPEYDEKT